MFTDTWRTHQLFGLIITTIAFCWMIAKPMGKWYAIALCYSVISAIWLFQNPEEVWPGLMIRIDATSANAAFVMILISAVIAFAKKELLEIFLSGIVLAVSMNCVSVIIFKHGMFHGSSMDNAAAALCLPFAFYVKNKRWQEWTMITIILTSIFVRHGTTALVMLFAMTFVQIFYAKKIKKGAILALSLAILGVGYVISYKYIMTLYGEISIKSLTSERYHNWAEGMTWWWSNANLFFGTGTGSYQWIGPAIHNQKTLIYIWMHNEYLQGIFEQGLVGLALFVTVYVIALRKSISQPWLFTTFIGLGIMSITQFPFRFFITQLMIVLLLRMSQENEEKSRAEIYF